MHATFDTSIFNDKCPCQFDLRSYKISPTSTVDPEKRRKRPKPTSENTDDDKNKKKKKKPKKPKMGKDGFKHPGQCHMIRLNIFDDEFG